MRPKKNISAALFRALRPTLVLKTKIMPRSMTVKSN